ncbi:hypothetical protein RF11_11867 [Thelohanellus kitauei]|uniref:Uncharacterized protein n=1 Tax=Thelohanellus kitauei TaxID=669202 RepID=A0A0C2NL02_THEKT|nr:hypothetical protein RF11_11867 [Thelohanellus kitauei]
MNNEFTNDTILEIGKLIFLTLIRCHRKADLKTLKDYSVWVDVAINLINDILYNGPQNTISPICTLISILLLSTDSGSEKIKTIVSLFNKSHFDSSVIFRQLLEVFYAWTKFLCILNGVEFEDNLNYLKEQNELYFDENVLLKSNT